MHLGKRSLESCPFAAPCWLSWEENRPWPEMSFLFRTPGFAPLFFAHKGSVFPWLVAMELPSAFAESGSYSLDNTCFGTLARAAAPHKAFRDFPSVFRVPPFPEGHQIGARKRRNRVDSIPKQTKPQPHLNRADSHFVGYIGGEFGPTPAGKTPPNSYPKTSITFRRERARYVILFVYFVRLIYTVSTHYYALAQFGAINITININTLTMDRSHPVEVVDRTHTHTHTQYERNYCIQSV